MTRKIRNSSRFTVGQTVSASELARHCARVLQRCHTAKKEIIITRHNQPMFRLTPLARKIS